ncbi:MAG TPA: patatin-like phospholipase family protein [Pyrinomonadaceae bacterium]|nr:patatin-like phospholipase family protein [Pyrinomonadaceae bacterium]
MPDTHDASDDSRKLECDLVMKGGITSGIIYPPLVIKLHQHGYSFRNIGGTSAGAIAAAVAAAAEYGKDKGGFDKLEKVRKWLGEDGNLRNLFQPSNETRPLMDTAFGAIAYFKNERRRHTKERESVGDKLALAKKALRLVLDMCALLSKTTGRLYSDGALVGLFAAGTAAFAFALFVALVFLFAGALFGGWKTAAEVSVIGFFVLFVPLAAGFGWVGERAGGLAGAARGLLDVVNVGIPGNFLGLCNGRQEHSVEGVALTDWLSEKINELAGLIEPTKPNEPAKVRRRPLTFRELWGAPTADGGRQIDLRMMTSNLSQNQPYLLPFVKSMFIFKREEMARLFPPAVVEHMVEKARECRGVVLPKGYFFLPGEADLPVVVAARMSLSFPVLISMVPLYTISQKAFENNVRCEVNEEMATGDSGEAETKEVILFMRENEEGNWEKCMGEQGRQLSPEDLQINWFSDGGICSNFPIHFFDTWLPSRPTFGVNLTSQLAEGGGQVEETVKSRSSVVAQQTQFGTSADTGGVDPYAQDVYLPRPDETLPPEWIPIRGLGDLFSNMFTTAQNYRDNMQAMLPSYRERIVQIRLTDDEGGLNLDMPKKTLESVAGKGEVAGNKLIQFKMDQHQWVRFRVLMKQMEKSLYDLKKAIAPGSFYEAMLKTRPLNSSYPYQRDDGWLDNAKQRLEDIGGVIDQIQKMNPEILFSDESPLPEPALRVTPHI